jgi:hypothetical protein
VRHLPPKISFIKFNVVFDQEIPILVLKRSGAVMGLLVSHVGLEGIELRLADRKGTISALSCKPAWCAMFFVDPFGGICLD